MKKIFSVALISAMAFLGAACSSTSLDKEVKAEAKQTKPMTGDQIYNTFVEGIKTGNFSDKKKKELNAELDRFVNEHKKRTKKSRQLITLAINHAADKDYPLSKVRSIMAQFERNEKAIVKNKVKFLASMRVFIQDKLDTEYEKQMVRDLLMESDFMDRETLYQMK